ncbi:LuxR C-terminal-related transcriptional regulator [Streptomyces sp. NPDC127117]|uniref:LuxR C-terminal-related transcriptional regulator n=1 Tax=Streptomyces sp. NPDC127117 TaxID=3345368 RepID=UPI00363F19E3
MTGALTVAQRRTQVRQLAQTGSSNRQIAAQLGISKDTVRRDLATPEAPTQTRAERFAARVAQTESAMSQLGAAVQAVADAKPAYTPVDEETARRWYAELLATADRLMAHANDFADYYPSATACATTETGAP